MHLTTRAGAANNLHYNGELGGGVLSNRGKVAERE